MKIDLSKLRKDSSLGIVICGYSGIGKTTLGKKYTNIAEIGQSLYRNIYEGIDAASIDREARKNIKTGVKRNPEWPGNYVRKINELRKSHDLVLVFTDFELLDAFRRFKIPFLIAIPTKDRKYEFIDNFKKRGQNDDFCKKASENWDEKLDALVKMNEPKIILKKGEFLEDYLKKISKE